MFAWSRLEIWIAIVMAGLIVVGGAARLWSEALQRPRVIVVEAGEDGEDDGEGDGENSTAEGVRGAEGEEAAPAAVAGGDDGAEAGGGAQVEGEATSGDAGPAPQPDLRIDINTASASELERLPGIGPALAGRIVEYRERWGPFDAIEDIMEVSGIGPVKFAQMQHLIKVR